MPTSWASKTLRLPKSQLPPRAIVTDRLKYIKQVTDDLYFWQKSRDSARFVLHDGPPYANGDLHIGHALNKILKDITCRYQVSLGRRVEFRPGWDCHGLPIELKALQNQREAGDLKDGLSLTPVEIRKAARELASRTVMMQQERFREWAIMADWRNPWRTMDQDYEIRQLELFKLMVKNGQIYRRLKPVYWSPSSRTALAEAELEYDSDHRSTAAYVKFPLREIPKVIANVLPCTTSTVSAVIWTTTPWTLPANRAIAVKEDMEYAVIQTAAIDVLVVATSRLAEFETICPDILILSKVTGAELIGSSYNHPFQPQDGPMPILHSDFVTEDSGTGLVHVAPGHGMDDYKLCQQHDIEPFAPLDDEGKFTVEAWPGHDELVGKPVLTLGNKAVLEILQHESMLVATQKYRHKYPYDWRSKQPVIIRATKQWFADLSGIKGDALKSLADVKFVPSRGYDRLSSFIKSRSEWCISRQRAWGVPIPALYSVTGEAMLTAESITHILSVIRQRGIDSWWSDDPTDPVWVAPSLRSCGPFTRGRDTMDVWFDSGSSWTEMGPEGSNNSNAVTDVVLEGKDQHRGWFQSSLLTKVAQLTALEQNAAQAPFKTLITHGFTLDQHGRKMSKSEGNVISPAQIMDGTLLPPLKRKGAKAKDKEEIMYDGMGADALRWWAASSDFTSDLVVGKPMLQSINSSLAKLRVTFKLLTGLLDTHDLSRKVDFEQLKALDRLAIMQVNRLRTAAEMAYQEFAYHHVASAITAYVNADLSAFYIESIKDRCYVDAKLSRSRMHAQSVLWEIYRNLAHILLPITPLLIAETRDYLPAQLQGYDPFRMCDEATCKSVIGSFQDVELEALFDASKPFNLRQIWDGIKQMQEQARTEKLMGSSLDCYVAIGFPSGCSNPDIQALISRMFNLQSQLEDLFVVSKVSIISTEEKTAAIQSSEWFKHVRQEVKDGQNSSGVAVDIYVHAPEGEKCVRCWKYNVDKSPGSSIESGPSASLEEPVCQRCLGVLEGQRDESPDLFKGRANIARAAAACRQMQDSHFADWNWDLKT